MRKYYQVWQYRFPFEPFHFFLNIEILSMATKRANSAVHFGTVEGQYYLQRV